MRNQRCKRRGMAIVETFAVIGLVAVAIVVAAGLLGDSTQSQIEGKINGPTGILGQQAAAAKSGQ